MHHNHMRPAAIRARIRRAIDPCQIQRAEIRRDGAAIAQVDVWRYRKESFSAGLALALSGVLSGDSGVDRALILSALPEGVAAQPEDALVVEDGAYTADIVGAAPWPAVGPAAIVTLTLRERTP